MFRCLLLLLCCGCGRETPSSPAGNTATRPAPPVEQVLRVESPPPAPLPQFEVASIRVYTSEPGWNVFVDGSPARAADGGFLLTPCEVQASPGAHTLAITRAGRLDQSRQVLFAPNAEVVFDTAAIPTGESALLAAPYLNLAVGEAVPLHALNTIGNEFDPFVTSDGLAIFFAADRSEGRGIFTAARPSPLHPFEEPRLLRLTSSSEAAASPSIDGAGLRIVYTLPAKGRLRALTRSSPLAEFEEPQILLSDAEEDARYPAAQILSSGDRLYFTRERQGITETRVAFAQANPREPFGQVRIVQFPGEHPRLSSDGLRQYLFDGRQLRRARRSAVNLPFGGSELIAEVSPPHFVPSRGHRQFCVTDDEQWLFYSDDPLGSGDLWMLRLSAGPAWGVPLVGRSIEPRSLAAAAPPPSPETQPFETPTPTPQVPPPPPDPRREPLPYVAFRQQLGQAAAARDFDRALELIDTAQADPRLAEAQELVEWDRQDVQQLIQFWQDVEAAVRELRPGDRLRLGAIPVEFESYADGVLTAKARTTSIQKRLAELDAASIISLVDKRLAQAEPSLKFRAALFLTYAGDGSSSRRRALLTEAGPLGEEFEERLAQREAALAQQELARENISAALARIEQLEQQYPKSAAAAAGAALRERLYQRTEWRPVGSRRWTNGPEGEWTASEERVEGALLLSPRELERFELMMEYRINSDIGSGGVYFRYSGSGRLDRNALKIQLSNDAGMAPHQYCTGSLFAVQEPRVNAAKPLGEWNTFHMSVDGDRLRVWINGQETLRMTFPTSGLPPAGYVALDGVRGGITYRKIILSDQPLRE